MTITGQEAYRNVAETKGIIRIKITLLSVWERKPLFSAAILLIKQCLEASSFHVHT
jgi:hypothetical protein